MKKLLFLIPVVLFYSCKSEPKKQLEPEVIKESKDLNLEKAEIETEKTIIETDSIIELTEFNIEYLKSKTTPLSKIIDVNDIDTDQLNKIPNKFIQTFISNSKKAMNDSISLVPDYPGAYSFYQYKEYENFDLFTFTYDDESCCTHLYAGTTSKDSLSLINLSLMGYTGADGGWGGDMYGNWINEFSIGSTETSNYDNDLMEETNNSEIDTIFSETQLNDKGYFKYIEHHKVKYIGNTQTE